MKLKGIRESRNFEDTTGYGAMLKHLLGALTPDLEGPEGGYGKWLTDSLNEMSPQDMQIMHDSKLTIDEMQRYKALKAGKGLFIDLGAWPRKMPGE